jgi:acetylornithine deacetylase/succinyl-diaminopimelate desuccinylase-like protein
MSSLDQFFEDQADQFERELCELLRIPSISTNPPGSDDLARAAQWVADRFDKLGFAGEIIQTEGHPLVYAESPKVEGAPTVLVYGHYDVQPVEPLDAWISPPFEPDRRDGDIYARGATDDKGQVLTHLFGAQALIETEGRLPLNLKYLIEGEEEVGSESLTAYIGKESRRLACDCIVVSDGSQFAPGQPAITYGLRGIACFELRLNGPNRDLHSGSFGGSVTNPANALTQMLAALLDDNGKVQIAGFYDDVTPLSDRERNQFATLPFDEQQYLQQIGVSEANGESGFSTLERRWARPTFDINGIRSGHQGEGSKTIVPSTASAKLSFRLVPEQSPEKIAKSLEVRLRELCPPGIELELTAMHASGGMVVPLDSPFVQAAATALEHAFGRSPVFTREGGSIPVVATMHEALDADVLLLGWGQDDDNAHSPNEKFSLADFHRGIRASARLWKEISQIKTD